MVALVTVNVLSDTPDLYRLTIILLHAVFELIISIGIVCVVGVLYAADTINGRVYMIPKLMSAP